MRVFDCLAHQLGLAQQAHQAQGRHRADVHLLSSLLLPVVQSWLMMEVIRGCQRQPHIEIREICVVVHGSSRSKRSALLVVLESKASRPSTFGSWLAERVVGFALWVGAMSPCST